MEENRAIFSVKLKMPQPRKNYIIRQKLFEQLNKLEEYKLTIVKAGAGSGKTTLLSTFAIEKRLENLKWITLDDNMNQAFVFWNYVIEAVKEYMGASKENLQTFFDGNMQKENLWQILSFFANGLNNKKVILVLDDFQVITDDFLISTIDFFIKNLPEQIHLVLLTRTMPEIYLGELAIEDNLMVLDEDEIRFSENESRKFLLETLKMNKNEDEISDMIGVSEGWIGGLQLLSISAKDRHTQVVPGMKVSNRVLNDYITKEIFEFLTEKEQEFLMKTSILRYFNQDICDTYMPEVDFTSMMESILNKNLFVINVDENDGIFRYHAILGEYLSGIFEKLSTEKKSQLHNLAASIYHKAGDDEECLYHLFKIQEYEQIMKLILKMPQTALTFSYLMQVPMEEIKKNTDFAYQYFFYYYASVDEVACDKIYRFIKKNMNEDKTFEAFNQADVFFSDKWNFNKTNILSLKQIKELPLNSITMAFFLIKEAYFLYANSKFAVAIEYLDSAEKVYRKTGNIYIGYFVYAEKAQIYEDMGEFNKCLGLYKEMEIMTSQIHSLASSYYIGIAGIYLRQLRLEQAFQVLEKAKEFLNSNTTNIVRAYQYTRAEYYYLIGEDKQTEKILVDVMGQEAFQNIIYSARLLRYPIYRGQHKELAMQYSQKYEIAENLIDSLDCDLLYTCIQYEYGNKETASKLIDEIIAKARKMQNKLKIVEGALLKVRMLIENEGKVRDIQNLFMEAVAYAYAENIANPFWFEKDTVVRVLSKFREELIREFSKEEFEFLTSVLNADTKRGLSEKLPKEKNNQLEELSVREREVLLELASGKTNLQIAEKLCISLATVKSHINNIYGKMGVNNRVAAVNLFSQKH